MRIFRRIFLSIYAIIGLLLTAVLACMWYNVFPPQIVRFLQTDTMVYSLFACLGIVAAGFIGALWYALFYRTPKVLVLRDSQQGIITITQAALASQVTHIVAAQGDISVYKVQIHIYRNNMVFVAVWVSPRLVMDVARRGEELLNALTRELKLLCGDHLAKVHISYVQFQTRPEDQRDDQYDDRSDDKISAAEKNNAVEKHARAEKHSVDAKPAASSQSQAPQNEPVQSYYNEITYTPTTHTQNE